MTDTRHEILKTLSNTIGTNILSIKLYEHDGNKEAADRLIAENKQLESQLERMIKMIRSDSNSSDV